MNVFKVKTTMLVGHVHKLRASGLSKMEIRNDKLTNALLDRIFEHAWDVCEKVDEAMKNAADS